MSERKINVGVHVTHCCKMHGCSYGDGERCPVENGSNKQEYPCEECPTAKDVLKAERQLERIKREFEFIQSLKS